MNDQWENPTRLLLIVITHGPDTCAAVHPDLGDKARNGFGKLDAAAEKHGVKKHGGWVDAPGHEFIVLGEAPNAHAINEVMIGTEMFHWNTVVVHPVRTIEGSMPLAAQR